MSDFSRKLEAEIPALRRYARYLTRDADRADDLVQDSLERAIAKRRLWHNPERLRPWLFALQRNVYLNQLRRQTRRPAEVPMDQVFAESGQGEAQTGQIMAREVLVALDALEPDQREVLVLVAVEGLLYREVATVLGLPAGTVMSRLSRGRAQLRKALAGDLPPATSTLWRVK
jgi:RNA polymerase sigma-70 factor (ECF subfamily)